ncbi:MAG: hypothetical protein QXJ62_01315 [Nitrososphaeria archaeon]
MQKTEEKCKSGITPLEVYLHRELGEGFSEKNQLAVGDSILEQINKLVKTVEQLKKDVSNLKERDDKSHYRKNKRICYIPKKPLFEEVLAALRKNGNEPLKETISKVFEAAAKTLGLRDQNDE